VSARFRPVSVQDAAFMGLAIKEARAAAGQNEVPVGAVIVHEGKLVAKARNQVETLEDPTAHAEMIGITQAANTLDGKWLAGCTLYVTVEPCSMCAGALVLARIKRVCFGARDPKTGACGSVVNIARHPRLNHRIDVTGGVCADECGLLMTEFFKKKRVAGSGERIEGRVDFSLRLEILMPFEHKRF